MRKKGFWYFRILRLRYLCIQGFRDVQGVKKKMRRSFCLISLAKNMLEGWDIIQWKGGIHSFDWSIKTYLYDIQEPRYKKIKIEYQISKCLNIEKSFVWKSDTAAIYA